MVEFCSIGREMGSSNFHTAAGSTEAGAACAGSKKLGRLNVTKPSAPSSRLSWCLQNGDMRWIHALQDRQAWGPGRQARQA